MSPQLEAAILSGTVTLLASLLAAVVVLFQIGRQARYALQQSKKNEALKLKLEIYKELQSITGRAAKAASKLESYALALSVNVAATAAAIEQGYQVQEPRSRTSELMKRYQEFSEAFLDLIFGIERWQIVDLRLRAFLVVFHADHHEVHHTYYRNLFPAALQALAVENPETNDPLPWSVPEDSKLLREVEAQAVQLQVDAGHLNCHLTDLENELQNALLGDLFEDRIPPRKPLDPKFYVVTLDRHEELIAKVTAESAWGREGARVDQEVRDRLREKGCPVVGAAS